MSIFLPQILAMMVVISVPAVFVYLAAKLVVQWSVALCRRESREFLEREKRFAIVVVSANLSFVTLLAYGWLWELIGSSA